MINSAPSQSNFWLGALLSTFLFLKLCCHSSQGTFRIIQHVCQILQIHPTAVQIVVVAYIEEINCSDTDFIDNFIPLLIFPKGIEPIVQTDDNILNTGKLIGDCADLARVGRNQIAGRIGGRRIVDLAPDQPSLK